MIPITPDDGVVDATGSSKMETPTAERWGNHHTINFRLSIPPLASRYYITLLAGREQRSTERLKQEREKHPLAKTANMIVLFTVGFILGGSCWIGLQVLVTTILGLVGI